MGALFSGPPSAPSAPPPPPPLQSPYGGNAVQAGQGVGQQASKASGFGSTILTGPQGVTAPPNVTGKQLTGQ